MIIVVYNRLLPLKIEPQGIQLDHKVAKSNSKLASAYKKVVNMIAYLPISWLHKTRKIPANLLCYSTTKTAISMAFIAKIGVPVNESD